MRRKVIVLLTWAMLLCLAGCDKKKFRPTTEKSDMDDLKAARVGSNILFGEYEQDNDESNGKESIEWLVLDRQEDKILVISQYALDCMEYNTEEGDVTWETCSLRSWLNGTFYESAFTADERGMITETTVAASPNPEFDNPAGNETADRVFLLGIDEATRYFADDKARRCFGTSYSSAKWMHERYKNCIWWLRSPGEHSYSAATVCFEGDIKNAGFVATSNAVSIRPAMWIDLSRE